MGMDWIGWKETMMVAAQIVGVFAVALFLLSYQMKKRKNIILCNAVSRVLYILQYLMLGAYEGAVLDILGTVSSVMAQNKEKGFMRRHLKEMFLLINLLMVGTGIWLYEDVFSLGALIGVLLHTVAFWITKEKTIRWVSFLGSPFWLIFNLANQAYGSAVGDFLTMVSISTAIYRYDIKGEKNHV